MVQTNGLRRSVLQNRAISSLPYPLGIISLVVLIRFRRVLESIFSLPKKFLLIYISVPSNTVLINFVPIFSGILFVIEEIIKSILYFKIVLEESYTELSSVVKNFNGLSLIKLINTSSVGGISYFLFFPLR